MAELQQILQLYLENSALDSKAIAWAFHDPTDGAGPGIPDPEQVTPEQTSSNPTTSNLTTTYSAAVRRTTPYEKAPYRTGVDALRDGWRLLQMTQLIPHATGAEHSVSFLSYEFVFERVVDASDGVGGGT